VRIPVNVTHDSGNVTGIPANVTQGLVLRDLILCRSAFSAVLPFLVFGFFEFIGPCQAAGGTPPIVVHVLMHDSPPGQGG
jgi:hypothetical protein